MRTTIRKWGNSAAVRLPSNVMQAADLALNDEVDVREESGRIVLEPVRQAAYNLDDLVDGITEDNRHDAVEFGGPVGREAL